MEEKNPSGIRLFSYNSRHQQTRVETENGNVQENRYDVENLRFELLENGNRTAFVYHNGELLHEEGEEEKQTGYHLGAGTSASQRGQETYYYHRDEQLSTAFITGTDGTVRNSYQYDAFGNLSDTIEQLPNRVCYTGQQYDELTGQYYLRARYYNPVLGRFMQEDTYQGDGLNLYAYCKNNPVAYYDPSGCGRDSKNPDLDCVGAKIGEADDESESGKTTINGLEIINGKVDGKIPLDEYQEILGKSIHNEDSDTMTLGKFRPTINPDGSENWKIAGADSYNVIAHNNGDMYFDMKDGLYDATLDNYNLSYQNMFDDFNVPALDKAASKGKTIRFSHNPELKGYAGSFTDKEWKHLQENWGYLYLREEGGFWYAEK